MKAKIRTPFFEVGVKNYIYGDEVFELAKAADEASAKYGVDVLFIAPYTDIRRIVENTEHLIVLAPYMDTLRPGRGMAEILPESIKAAGAKGVVINHCERPMTLAAIRETIERANELELLSFVCADTIAEACAVAHFHPDIINPEPTELIGTTNACDYGYVSQVVKAVKAVDPNVIVEQAAGITTGEQVYRYIMSGAQAAGAASGIVNAKDRYSALDEMVAATARAAAELKLAGVI